SGKQDGQRALVLRGQMLDEDDREPRIGRQRLEQVREGVEPSSRGSDADDHQIRRRLAKALLLVGSDGGSFCFVAKGRLSAGRTRRRGPCSTLGRRRRNALLGFDGSLGGHCYSAVTARFFLAGFGRVERLRTAFAPIASGGARRSLLTRISRMTFAWRSPS